MTPRVITIANLVIDELKRDGIFPSPMSPVLNFAPEVSLDKLKDMKVSVCPLSNTGERLARQLFSDEIMVSIAIQKKLQDIPAETIELLALGEKICKHFRSTFESEECVCVKVENDPLFVPDHLRQYRVFTGVIDLTFKVLS